MSNTIDTPESDYLYIETSQLPNADRGLFTVIYLYKGEIISLLKGEEAKTRAKKRRR